MQFSSTTVGLGALLIICFLLGYEFVSFDQEPTDQSPFPDRDELSSEILDEVKKVEEQLLDIQFKSSVEHPDS